jgi:glycosyltransferase involved in cell wall biosynthesis
LKVLHVIPSISPRRGGPSAAVRRMAEVVASLGHTVHIVTTDDDGPGRLSVPLRQAIEADGVTYRYFPRQTKFYSFSWPLTAWLAKNIKNFDVVHIHALFSYPSVVAARHAASAGTPYIIRPLGTLNNWGLLNRRPRLKRLSLRWVERPVLARAAMVHFTSEQERTEAAALGISTPSVVLPLGLDLESTRYLPEPSQFLDCYPQLIGRPLILFLSRIDPIKGIDLLLPAMARIQQHIPDVALVIAGDGERQFVAELQSTARRLGISESVIWTGYLAGEQKLAALAAADIFVLPSYSESFAIAAVEALASGKPVVITDQVAIHHEVATVGAGLVVPCLVNPLATALSTLLLNPEQRQQMEIAAQKLAHSHFSSSIMGDRLIDMYHVVQNRP